MSGPKPGRVDHVQKRGPENGRNSLTVVPIWDAERPTKNGARHKVGPEELIPSDIHRFA